MLRLSDMHGTINSIVSESAPQRGDIQGLRALAVIAVVMFHIDSSFLPGGFVGVDIFFVISGYLITNIVLRQREQGNFSTTAFYIVRVQRIVPAYIVMLFATCLVMAVLMIPSDFDRFKESLLSALYFNSNNYFSSHNDYFGLQSYENPLLHTWSLAVEMQFYLLLPIVMIIRPRRFLLWMLSFIAASLLVYSTYQLNHGAPQAVYFSLMARIPEFIAGALLALKGLPSWSRKTNNRVALCGLTMVLGSFLLITENKPFPGVLALPACTGAVLLIAARDSTFNTMLSKKYAVLVGGLSYSLYLYHWPILAAFRYFFERQQLPAAAIAAVLLLTIIFSYLSYSFVEIPFRIGRVSFEKIPCARPWLLKIFMSSVLVVLLLASLPAMRMLNSNLISSSSVEMLQYAPQNEICHGQVLHNCIRGSHVSGRTLLLMGDSHAAQLNYFADVVGAELGIRFLVVSAVSCIPFKGFDTERIRDFLREPCLKQITYVDEQLPMVDGVMLAGHWVSHSRSETFMNTLGHFLEKTRASGMPVLVLAQVPMLTKNVHRLQRFTVFGFSPNSERETEWFTANGRVKDLVEGVGNIVFLDLSTLAVFEKAPFSGGQIIYYDNNHLNEFGARRYGKAAVPYIDKWIKENF